MGAVILPIVGLLIMITLVTLFFSKKTIHTQETKLFKILLILNTIFIITGLVTFFVAKTNGIIEYIGILQRIYMSILTVLNCISIYYCISLFDNKELNAFKIPLFIATLIFIVLILILPLNVIFENDYLDGNGMSYNIVIVDTVISFICFIVIFIYLLIKKYSIKKILPFIILIFLYIMSFFIREHYKELIFEGFFYSYILLIMYHTIENPDLKLLNEYNKNRELLDSTIENESNILLQITEVVKRPLNKIKLLNLDISNSKKISDIKRLNLDIEYETNNILTEIDNILNITTIDKKNIKYVEMEYNVFNLFNSIIYIIENEIDSNVTFKYSINSLTPDLLNGDSLKIKQMICSIIFFSLRNMKKGIVDLDINSIIRYDVCRLIITIRDTNKPLDIFEINDILKSTYSEKQDDYNMNMNLKDVKKLVEVMGGTMFIKSNKDYGNEYVIAINQLICDKNSNVEIKSLTDKVLNKKKVLIIDDEYKKLIKYADILKNLNYSVVTTISGKDFVDRISNNEKYDIIFIDDEMINVNAVQLISQVSIPKNTILIVMLENNKESIKKHYLIDYPFNDYLLKNEYEKEFIRINEEYK